MNFQKVLENIITVESRVGSSIPDNRQSTARRRHLVSEKGLKCVCFLGYETLFHTDFMFIHMLYREMARTRDHRGL